ncbi:hypothetical protein ACFVGN_05730 [Streptomyces sp. NPDC057757]|uniref:hypothetical protein n=1 Tax=Streptomyces sp. NPDC057757 TaxID=3346241 RepID=UPI0036BC421F
MTRYWSARTRILHGCALPPAEPGKSMWQPSSAIRRAENAVNDRRLARRFVQLAPGVLVIWERQPWQILAIDERPDDLWGDKYEDDFSHHLRLWESRKVGDKPERHTWRGRPVAMQLVPVADLKAKPLHLIFPGSHQWDVLPEHYAVCSACGELPPCRHELAEQEGDLIAARNDVLMDIPAGHCLGCGEYVTHRQKAARFPGPNLWRADMPDNSAVFHARQECAGEAERYRRQWEARGNSTPQPSLFADEEPS